MVDAEDDWVFAVADDDFSEGCAEFGWDDAFVAEVSIVSPSKVLGAGSVRSPGATPDLRMVIMTPTPPKHVLDIHVHLADEVHLLSGRPLDVAVRVGRTSVELMLGPDAGRVRGRALRFRLRGLGAAGKARLGREFPPDADFDDDRFWQPR